ncbi:hypothetical protein OAT16_02665 [Prolixibacteraceae bacterium]|nr:hypothetical protein [Prolixibacteraceae bacterium]
MVRKILYIHLLLLISTIALGQKPFAKAYINRSQVYKSQPLKLTIKVYSPRWFTQGLQFENLKIEDAFIVPFTQTLAGKEIVNRHSYAVLTFFYLVFPYNTGTIHIPKVPVTTYIPMGNSYKETKIELTTNNLTFKSLPLPPNAPNLVASNVYIKDRWNKTFNKLYEGDVLEREITITAYGTIPNFIPFIEMKEVSFAKIYKTQNLTQQNIDKESGIVISKRIEKFSYLLTKEGEFSMPGTQVTFFNPLLGSYKEKNSMPTYIEITKNTQLGIVESMIDSLETQQARIQSMIPKEQFKRRLILFTVQHKWQLFGIAILILLIKQILKARHPITAKISQRKREYISSERHAFKELLKEGKFSSPKYLTKLYRWMYKLPNKEVSIIKLVNKTKGETFKSVHERVLERVYRNRGIKIKENYQYTLWKYRRLIFQKKEIHKTNLEDW